MRILFLAHRLPYPPDKGDKIRSFFELQVLGERHEVDLCCFYDYEEDAQYIDIVRRYCRSVYAERLKWTSSRFRAVKAMLGGTSFTLGYFYSPEMAERVKNALASTAYDLIFIFSSSMAQYAECATAVPRIIDLVDVDSDKWTQYGLHSHPPKSWLWELEGRLLSSYEEKIVNDFSLTLLCTEAEADLLRRRIPSPKIAVLNNRVDETYWDPEAVTIPPEISARQPYVIFTGSMDYLPNEDAVLHFYRDYFLPLREAVPEINFVIAGRNPSQALCRLQRDPAVCVTGSVQDIRPWLLGASAAVAPLRIARGIQNKVLEALAMGLPVFANRKTAGALPKELRDITMVEEDPIALAKGLSELLHDPSRVNRCQLRKTVVDALGTAAACDRLESLLSLASCKVGK